MDWLARIFDWLREQEAGFSALAAIAVLAGILFTGVRFLLSRRSESGTDTASEEDPLLALPTGPVVAVLPFENLSRDPDQEYFSDGLTEDIITALSRFEHLFVIARNSTFRYKGQPVDVRQLKKELGARYVLEGSVQKDGDTLRVTAQLLDAKHGTHLWAETYDRELSAASIFAVQDEITEQVVATIAGIWGVISQARFAESKAKPTESLATYEWVLKASAYYRDNWNTVEHAKIRDGLERVTSSDPDCADAWAWLTFIYLDEHRFNFNPLPDPLDRALETARMAVASEPNSQRGHEALAEAHFYRHELDAFLAETDRALALNPNNASTLGNLGDKLCGTGEERGVALVKRAMKLDPFHPTWCYLPIAAHHFDRGEFERALAAARKITIPGFVVPHMYLAAIYAALGCHSEARSTVAELLKISPDSTVASLIENHRKRNTPEDSIRRWVAALRKAGLAE